MTRSANDHPFSRKEGEYFWFGELTYLSFKRKKYMWFSLAQPEWDKLWHKWRLSIRPLEGPLAEKVLKNESFSKWWEMLFFFEKLKDDSVFLDLVQTMAIESQRG